MSRSKKSRFITVEGIEGVGKTSNIENIAAFLDQAGIKFVLTREPGGTTVAELIRDLLLQNHQEKIDEVAELLLVFASRAQHIAQVIKPALAGGQWVICDRFTDATYAYQGGGRGLSSGTIAILESLVQQQLRPDLTFILDLDPEIGLRRASRRGELDRFEQEKIEFFNRVRSAYLERAAADPHRCKVVDASQELDKVQYDIVHWLRQYIDH